MQSQINLFIHPTFAKSGTTFLQDKIFSKIDFGILGKPYDPTTEQNKKLVSLQYEIFQPKYSFNRIYPLNYSFLIKNYANELEKIILTSKKKNFILSDECIFDKENYFGYFNMYLLKEIIDLLSLNLNINIKFIVSIRKQDEILISSYAYDNDRKKKNFGSLKQYINKVLSDNNLSEIYCYDLMIEKIKKIYNSEILVLPLEQLENSSDEYFLRIKNFLKITTKFEYTDKVNFNSTTLGNKKKYYIRTLDARKFFINILEKFHYFLKRSSFYKKNYTKIKFLKKFIYPSLSKKNLIGLDENLKNEIQQHFSKSNQNLEKQINLNLKQYNYY